MSGGLPGWAALPAAIAGASLLVAVTGFYWDVATHIDDGRDDGPFANAAHYLILLGLGGIAIGGLVAVVLGTDRPQATSVRLRPGWYVPSGGLMILLCGVFALTGFPLDDVWHRLFGQDVTLWGPTHVLMVAGASLATLGVWALLVEGARARALERPGAPSRVHWSTRVRVASMAGAFLIGLSTLQGEFDFGVPQFRLLFQPTLIMLAAGIGLVAARVRLGPTGALQAVAFFLVVRGVITVLVGPVLGHSTMHFPLYLAEAALVELAALRIKADRPLTLGVVAGALIGTVGLGAEWAWSHVWMPIAWPASLLPEAAVLGLVAAVAGGVIGAFVGDALQGARAARPVAPRWAAPAATLAALACVAYPLPIGGGAPASAQIAVSAAGPDAVHATVTLSPRDSADGAAWLNATAWQGGGLQVDPLRRVADGVYATVRPLPARGEWKSLIRLHRGNALNAIPIYLPPDDAIPAAGVPAIDSTRPFIADREILQREATGEHAGLKVLAYVVLASIVAVWLAAMAWALARLSGTARGPTPRATLSARTT